jgi:RNA polymerase sigma-70 factor (ECF subfamily)
MTTRVAKALMNRYISHSASNFQADFVTHGLWHTDCLFPATAARRSGGGVRIHQNILRKRYKQRLRRRVGDCHKCGDTQAFEELVFRHEPRALATAQRIAKNREDAEGVVQESFHKAFFHLDDFEEKARFSTWLTRIVMNEAYLLLRRRRRVLEVLPECPDDRMESASEAFVDQSPSPEGWCWRRERTQLLTEAINRLGPKIRSTIFLATSKNGLPKKRLRY